MFEENDISSRFVSNHLTGGAISIQEYHGHSQQASAETASSGGLPFVSVTFQDCTIMKNGVEISESPIGTDEDSPFLSGGAISVSFDRPIVHMTLKRVFVSGNHVSASSTKAGKVSGGAINFVSYAHESHLEITNSTLEHNSADGGGVTIALARTGLCYGGCISIISTCHVGIHSSILSNNECSAGQGGTLGSQAHGGAISFELPPSDGPSVLTNDSLLSIHASDFVQNFVMLGESDLSPTFVATGGAVHLNLQSNVAIGGVSFVDSTFQGNYIASHGSTVGGVRAGGALFIQGQSITLVQALVISGCNFARNKIFPALYSRADSGGAVAMMLGLDLGSPLLILASKFERNKIERTHPAAETIVSGAALHLDLSYKPGVAARGAATSLVGVFYANISDSVWVQNQLLCISTDSVGTAAQADCEGGAAEVTFEQRSKQSGFAAAVDFLNCSFYDNTILLSSRVRCVVVEGGALSLKTRQGMDTFVRAHSSLSSCHFERNYAEAGVARGGAVSAYGPLTSISQCSFIRNHVSGASSDGGAVWAQSLTSIRDSQFSHSYAASSPNPICTNTYSNGGTMALESLRPADNPSLFNVTVKNSFAARGGAIFLRSLLQSSSIFFNLTNVFVRDSYASEAGGALFLDPNCLDNQHEASRICEGLEGINVTALGYGNICASSAVSMEQQRNVSTIFVASGQPHRFAFFYPDLFGNMVYEGLDYAAASLSNHSSGVRLHTNVARDQAVVDSDHMMTFSELFITGNPGSRAQVVFNGFVSRPSCKSRTLRVVVDLRITACLPSYFPVDNQTCQLCPSQHYSFDGSQSHCKPCDEEGEALTSGDVSDYSCLTPVEQEDMKMVWKVSEGFYPYPSLEEPEELVKCPNHACLPFECKAYLTEHNEKWSLNCSACPEEHANTTNHHDCHCKLGYEGRLCSRCSCDAASCYFSSGEIEERHCTKCQSSSSAVVISALTVLQVSLIIFLLFRQSALAAFLAEVAVVIALVLAGIGEAWMFNLVIIMGLLFIIMSLSRRKYARKSSDNRNSFEHADESDAENSDFPEHSRHDNRDHHEHHHTAQTAALAKIIIFFLQSASAIIQDSAWPSWIGVVMKQLDAVNLKVSGVECFAPTLLSQPLGKLLFQLAMPLLLGINIAVAALISALIIKLDLMSRIRSCWTQLKASGQRRRVEPEESISDSDPSFTIEQQEDKPLLEHEALQHSLENSRSKWDIGDLLARLQFSVLFLMSASYFELSSTVLELLRPCTSQGFMPALPWISCSRSNSVYISLLATAIAFFIIFSIGIPAAFGFILLRNQRRIKANDPALEAKYGFLYESYKPQYYWFELIWFLRRILLSIAVSMTNPSPGYQMAMIFVILQGSLIFHRAIKPFSSKLANRLDQFATATLLFGVVMGFVLNRYKEVKNVVVLQNMIWVCIALVACAIVIALLRPSVQACVGYFRRKLRQE